MLCKRLYMKLFVRFCALFLISIMLNGCGKNRVLIDSISTDDMSRLTMRLAQKGILAEIARNNDATYKVTVLKDDFIIAQQTMLDMGLFIDNNDQDLFKLSTKSSMVENEFEQQFKFNTIVSKQLSMTIMSLKNVTKAQVYISQDISGSSTFNFADIDYPVNKMKASVYVKMNSNIHEAPDLVSARVKKIVAGAIQGLNEENINVVIEFD